MTFPSEFEHLMRYVTEHEIVGDPVHSEIEYGLGSFYPTPGGLAENVKWFLGEQTYIRQIEGERHLYEWMHQNKDRIRKEETPFVFIDALLREGLYLRYSGQSGEIPHG